MSVECQVQHQPREMQTYANYPFAISVGLRCFERSLPSKASTCAVGLNCHLTSAQQPLAAPVLSASSASLKLLNLGKAPCSCQPCLAVPAHLEAGSSVWQVHISMLKISAPPSLALSPALNISRVPSVHLGKSLIVPVL